jgi:hypothetical protein
MAAIINNPRLIPKSLPDCPVKKAIKTSSRPVATKRPWDKTKDFAVSLFFKIAVRTIKPSNASIINRAIATFSD